MAFSYVNKEEIDAKLDLLWTLNELHITKYDFYYAFHINSDGSFVYKIVVIAPEK